MKKTASFLAAALLGLGLLASSPAAAADTTIVTGKVMSTVTRAPNVHFNGVVEEVLVTPGQHVAVGDPILKYSLQDEARRSLQREVRQGPGTENKRAEVLELQRQLVQARAQRDRASALASKGLGSSQTSGRMELDVTTINGRIDLARAIIAKAETNFAVRLEELSDYFNTEITEGMTLPPYLYLKSPIDGYVLSINSELNPGATFKSGIAPIVIGKLDPMRIKVPVYEADLSLVHVGDDARVEIPTLNDRKYQATVTEIAWVANDMNVAQASYYNVELSIPNPDLALKPGFKAVVRFGR